MAGKKNLEKKGKKPEKPQKAADESKSIITDKRFQHVHSDPRFQIMPKKQRKLQIDKRFQGMFTDPRFKTNYTVDKYGRKVETDTYGDDLHRMYDIEGDDEDERPESESENAIEDPDRDVSRVGFDVDSSDDESSDDDEVEVDSAAAAKSTEPEEDIPMGDETPRFAVVNLEWDRLRAVDLLVLFQSFAADTGFVKNVSIYSSEYGREMMKKEQESGPQDIWKNKDDDDNDDGSESSERDSDDDGDLDMERVRNYEKQKLKYYFAVVTCSSVECAAHLYSQCDGNEFEQTSNMLDLRFIPDDQQFSEEHLRDSAHEVPSNYTPTEFYTSSLKHTNMKCTWDAEDPNRKDFFQRRISNLKPDDRDIEVYLAPAESDAEGSDFVISADESDGEGNKVVLKKRARSRYLALLEEINAKADGNDADKQMGDITISFEPGLSNAGQAILDAKKKKEQIANETVWEARQRKRKEKKMQKKSDLVEEAGVDQLTKDEMDDPFFRDAFKDDHYVEQTKTKSKKSAVKLTPEQAEEEDRKRAELELLVMDEGRDNATDALHRNKGYNLQQLVEAHEGKGKRKKKSHKRDDIANDDGLLVEGNGGAELNVNNIIEDKRFGAIFEKEEFAIDPTDPAFKNTEVMAKLQQVRQKIRKEKNAKTEESVRERKRKALEGDLKESEQQKPGKVDTATLVRKLKSNAMKRKKQN